MDPIHEPMNELHRRIDLEIPRHLRYGLDVTVYRDFVARHEKLVSISEMGKNNELAEKYRLAGNRAYSKKLLNVALGQFNWSLCYATESKLLALAYGNRSTVYYEQGEYEFALYNIDLAKANNYPERLMPKLLAREVNCKREIRHGLSHGMVPHPLAEINVEVNPKIPFLAKGIAARQLDGDEDPSLVAERDFNTGDVILHEKIDLCAVLFKKGNSYCAHCGSAFRLSLIPCPGCVTVMYCGEECRKEDLRTVHRFECTVVTKLWSVTYTNMLMGAKLFFFGLTAFNDNITAMMEYCSSNAAVDCKPLDLDLTHPNPLEVFKALHHTQPRSNSFSEHLSKLYAAIYSAIFMKNPLVQSIIRTEAQRDFMLRCLLTHNRVASSEVSTCTEMGTLSVIDSVFEHSCDPNVSTVIHTGTFKTIVIRPIKTGDKIFTTYGPTWWCPDQKPHAQCKCVVCDRGPEGENWRAIFNQVRPISPELEQELLGLERMSLDLTAGLVKFQRAVQLMACQGHHPGKKFGNIIRVYNDLLSDFVTEQNEKRNRAKLLQMRGDEVVPGLFDV